MYKEDLALNNLKWLICHKTQPNHIYLIYMYKEDLVLNDLQWLICHKTQLLHFILAKQTTHYIYIYIYIYI